MERQTNLRGLRLRYRIPLTELANCSKLSMQYISRAELGQIAATPCLEKQLASALEMIINHRRERLELLEAEYRASKDSLLGKEKDAHEP